MSNTFTRVGTANMYDNALRNLGERHSSLVGLQDNLTAGKRVVRPSDDPVAAAQAERARNRLERMRAASVFSPNEALPAPMTVMVVGRVMFFPEERLDVMSDYTIIRLESKSPHPPQWTGAHRRTVDRCANTPLARRSDR